MPIKKAKSAKRKLAAKKRATVQVVKAKKAAKAAGTAKKTAKSALVKKKAASHKPAVDGSAAQVFDMSGKKLQSVKLDPIFTEGPVNTDVIYQAVVAYQAGSHLGTASTKDRGAVSGGGKKPWKQKGTGRARHGSSRSPIWRHGGTTFGPQPRDYSYTIPQKIRRKAVIEGFKDKAHTGKLMFIDKFNIEKPKTKIVAGVLEALNLQKPLFVVAEKSQNLLLASRNIPGVGIRTANEVNALDVVSHSECVLTQDAYQGLVKRLKS
ncbi:MAG: hypothetical protein MOGMAGMI_01386 [Candidatus Omnitrophica bacterium]|nr:hypothetical protein [Candidatus Omnitrophota bacterium]